MTTIQKVDSNTRPKHLLNPKNTGYAAAGAMLFTTARAVSNAKNVRKTHKTLGYITAALTVFHIALTEYYHHKYKKM